MDLNLDMDFFFFPAVDVKLGLELSVTCPESLSVRNQLPKIM